MSDYPNCFICEKVTNSLAGDPGRWPVRVGIPNGNGETRTLCGDCIAVVVDQFIKSASKPEGQAK